ncbi:MAG: hypothetical protein ACRDRX_18070 [Pseudonocardiaceae bacterium]
MTNFGRVAAVHLSALLSEAHQHPAATIPVRRCCRRAAGMRRECDEDEGGKVIPLARPVATAAPLETTGNVIGPAPRDRIAFPATRISGVYRPAR